MKMGYKLYEDYKQWLQDWKLTDKGKAWMERKRQYAREARQRKKQNDKKIKKTLYISEIL